MENENHSDFLKLRKMMFRTNMERLRSRTATVYYERYRHQRLLDMGIIDGDGTEQALRCWGREIDSRVFQCLNFHGRSFFFPAFPQSV